MKNQIVITVAGEANTGKSAIATIIEAELRLRGVEVKKDDVDEARISGLILNQISATIKTRLTPEPGKKGAGPLTDEECLAKLKEVRDYLNGLTEAVEQTRAHGEALATIDEVADEIEDRLSKASTDEIASGLLKTPGA